MIRFNLRSRHPRESGDPDVNIAFEKGLRLDSRFRGNDGALFRTSVLSYGVIFLFLLPLLSRSSLLAANKNVGTSGAQFLKIGAGARSTAMGDSFVGLADDVNAVYFNPSGLAFLENPELTAMHTQYFQGLNYDFGAFVYPGASGTYAVSAATLRADDLDKRDENEASGGTFETLDAHYGLSYARTLTETLAVGLTGRLIRQEIDTYSAQTWSGDLGVLKRFPESPLRLGLAVRHLGSGVKFRQESDPLPLTIDGGVSSAFIHDHLTMALNLKKSRDNDFQYGVGSEWKQSLRGDVFYAVRGGYNSSSTDADGSSGLTLGAGLNYRTFGFDFAWVPMGDLGNTFRYAAVFKFK